MSVWPNGTHTIPRVSSEFGPRVPPTRGASSNHLGIDLIGLGAIRAAVNGTIIFAQYNGGSGLEIRIAGDDGREYRYKHNSRVLVGVGARVGEGQQIAVEGRTGNVTGVHSHFEVLIGGRQVNPRNYIGPSATGAGAVGKFDQNVASQQSYLNATRGEHLAVDGKRGPQTIAAIIRYQAFIGVKPDGVWGPATQAQHTIVYNRLFPPKPPVTAPTVPVGSFKGNWAGVQYALKTKYPMYAGGLVVDNIIGPKSIATLKEFQRRAGLYPDGIPGPKTRGALGL